MRYVVIIKYAISRAEQNLTDYADRPESRSHASVLRLVICWNQNMSYLGKYMVFHYLYIFSVSNDNI